MATGDVGHFDEAGRLFVDGRDDDMIVSGGENVFPREVEDLLAGHDGGRRRRGVRRRRREVRPAPEGRRGQAQGQELSRGRGQGLREGEPRRATRCRATSSSSTSCRGTRPARSSSASCVRRPDGVRRLGIGDAEDGLSGASAPPGTRAPSPPPAAFRAPDRASPGYTFAMRRTRVPRDSRPRSQRPARACARRPRAVPAIRVGARARAAASAGATQPSGPCTISRRAAGRRRCGQARTSTQRSASAQWFSRSARNANTAWPGRPRRAGVTAQIRGCSSRSWRSGRRPRSPRSVRAEVLRARVGPPSGYSVTWYAPGRGGATRGTRCPSSRVRLATRRTSRSSHSRS